MKKLLTMFLLATALNLFAAGAMVINSISQTLSNIGDIEGGSSSVDNSFAILGETQGSAPNKMDFYQNYIFVCITYGNSIQKINAVTGESSYIYLESGSLPNDISIDKENGFGYVTGNGTNKVYKITLVTEEIVGSVDVGVAPQGMEIANDKLYVANTAFNMSDYSYGDGTISVINLSDFSNIQTLNTSHKNPISVEIADNHIFAICMGDWSGEPNGGVDIFNIGETEPSHTIDLSGGHPSAAVALLGYDVRKLYVGSISPSGVWVIDPDTFEVIEDIADSAFEGGASLDAWGLALITADPLEWQSNSVIRAYDVVTENLIASWETAVGVTDVKFYTDLMGNDDDAIQPITFSMGKPYPNPFYQKSKSSISIDYYSAKNSKIACEIYNIKGQKIVSFDKNAVVGNNLISWNSQDKYGKNVPSGIYYFKVIADGKSAVKKVTVIK